MNLFRVSRLEFAGLYRGQGSIPSLVLSCKKSKIVEWSCCFQFNMVNKCHYSQIYRPLGASVLHSNKYCSNLLLRDPVHCNENLASFPLSVANLRHRSHLPYNSDRHRDRLGIRSIEAKPGGSDEATVEQKDPVKIEQKAEEQAAGPGLGESEASKLSLYQRFKKTYKEHGKVLVVVHLITSAVWFGSFYTVARCGFDIVPYLESWNFSEKIISPFRSGGLGDVALAYLMYKLATPARYTVTIGGTNLAIRYLRKEGKIPQVAQEDTIRSLYKEGKENIKRRSHAHLTKLRKRRSHKHRTVSSKDKTES